MKIKTSPRRICKNCKLIFRKKRFVIICINLKHKQKQG
uniref:Ribosomal protein n=1 Tax=Mitrastemon kanehirai TaxID=1358725 RepID=A0A4Y1MCJ6_9ERIC|nr:ribosomal protein L36 [Mitrastemon yamamotoi]AWS06644.1 ribosomal protein L36 [Mitrastemon kanehirai]USS58000.1 ribosomal protein L36 [Mitrastemon yamamotoi]